MMELLPPISADAAHALVDAAERFTLYVRTPPNRADAPMPGATADEMHALIDTGVHPHHCALIGATFVYQLLVPFAAPA